MNSVSVSKLESKFPGEGLKRFSEIAEAGGFGSVAARGAEGGLDRDSDLDLVGVLDPENKAITDAKKNKIRELAGIAADSEPSPSESSASKMKTKEGK